MDIPAVLARLAALEADVTYREPPGEGQPPFRYEPGTLPVLVSRVGWTFTAPWLKGVEAIKKDFSLQEFGRQSIDGDSITVSPEEPLFYMQLKRTN